MAKRKTIKNKADKSRRIIANICRDNDWTRCMARLNGCMGEAHAPAHRRKRRHYKSIEELTNTKEWMPMCQYCHHKTEYDRKLNNKVFERWNNAQK